MDEGGNQPDHHDQPDHGDSSSPPALLTGAKTWIAGVSAVVIALAGLKGAWHQLFPDQPAAAEAKAPDPPPQAAAAVQASEPEEGDPTLYTGDKLRMEWDGKVWQLSSPDGVFTYEEMLATEGNWVLGYDKSNDEYIRWPLDGGTMEYSRDDRQSWITYGEVQPDAG